ncbi:prepilin-type N-terminal cleavage/methylation domain-containing protein [Candidatus Gottesmanbacteria bacterium]|nr:prepilin-type N-terminal cleavage/methylation domain-containing protein [Candidatus Gottesmanbacteria bacterium]
MRRTDSHARRRYTDGFTLVEVIIVGTIMAIMFMLSTQSLFGGIRSATLDQVSSSVMRDLNTQQARAINGLVSPSGSVVDYSVRFETDRYILYPGAVYDMGNSQNQEVLLDPTMRFTVIAVPDQAITYARSSGKMRGFITGADYVELSDTETGSRVTIRINEAGALSVVRE